jgi:hypothetical protein
MKYRLQPDTNPYATHEPVLYYMCNKPNLKILEFGCGDISTRLLSLLTQKYNHQILSFDNNYE